MLTTSCSRARACTRSRRGRLLVECLVASLLLEASALVVVSLARGAAASTRNASGTAAAWSLAVQGVEAAVAAPCQSGNSNGVDALPLVDVSWSESGHAGWSEREVHAALTNSALAGARVTHLTLRAARSCP